MAFVKDKEGRLIRFSVAKTAEDIDQLQGKEIFVRSFMQAYKDIPLPELNVEFKTRDDVRHFYERYLKKNLRILKIETYLGASLLRR